MSIMIASLLFSPKLSNLNLDIKFRLHVLLAEINQTGGKIFKRHYLCGISTFA